MEYDRTGFTDSELIHLYEALLRPRLIEEKMLKLLRQGQISKWFSGIGQEAISVGAAEALAEDELLFTMHRNLGVFTSRKVPFERLFAQWQGKRLGFTKGRDRSFHFGSLEHGIVGMISHLGPQLSLADGVALAHQLSNEQKVALAFTGDGATSEGEFHEALNVAAVWQLPVIFIIESNGYGLSTPNNEQYRCEKLADRGIGYGMRAMSIDGNNILEVYNTIKTVAAEIRSNPEPVMIECMTFRMRGHEEASGTKYVPTDLMEYWAKKDPIQNFEDFLKEAGLLTANKVKNLQQLIKKEIEEGLRIANQETAPEPDISEETQDIYQIHQAAVITPSSDQISEKRFIDAIADGLRQAMEKFPKLV
ncbi:MAG: thiamine pyrophosphate-dependent dehydrogenase E1 component subunit alpha, partial [Bacteroidota bacterium]